MAKKSNAARMDERAEEASYAFVMTYNLSAHLFDIFLARGVNLPHRWHVFEDDWLTEPPRFDRAA